MKFFILLAFLTNMAFAEESLQCVERGLKCCHKARGKRAMRIYAKCEKKYKCTCPKTASDTTSNPTTKQH